MSWKVELDGDKADLAALAQSLDSKELAVTREGDTFFLESNQFGSKDDGDENYRKALDLLEKLNGALRLEFKSTEPLTVRAVHEPRKDGGYSVYVPGRASIRTTTSGTVSFAVRRTDGTVKTSHAADPIRDWISIQKRDEAAAQVLGMLAKENDWRDLYWIFDKVRHDCGREQVIASRGWATKKAMKLFRQTVNSETAIGQEARHGAETTKPPPDPMSMRDARLLIHGIARQWLCWKVQHDSGSASQQ
ncbi:MAG: hypothetical protein KKI02_09245 [Planctomycetes bacterium]|nr:hypothetical protein [Planctomycetota bacterium]